MANTTAPKLAKIFLDYCIIPYGIPTHLFTDNGPQFMGKFFAAIFELLGTEKITTTCYHPQTNGQTETYIKTIVNLLRHFVSESQGDWEK